MVAGLSYYYTYKETGNDPWNLGHNYIIQRAQNAMESWAELLDNYDKNEWWEAADPKDHYKYLVDGLSSTHIGDCTAHPATCIRCNSESLFKIPYSATWSKSEGHKMFNEYSKDKKEKEKVPEHNVDYVAELDELRNDFDNFDKLEAEFKELIKNEQK
jgi:hypothetical protein